MGGPGSSVEHVYDALTDALRSGGYAAGTRLPSVRRLAVELGSNPSTVDRALQRLVEEGAVRTVARRGTWVTGNLRPRQDTREAFEEAFRAALDRARGAGLGHAAITGAVERVLADFSQRPSVAFVECNPTDLQRMARMVGNATGIEVLPVLLGDCPAALRDVDVVAVPLFHLNEIRGLGVDPARIVDLGFSPNVDAVRRLARLDQDAVVAVSSPTQRGLDRFRALVAQYFPGEVRTVGPESRAADLEGVTLLVHSAAAGLADEVVSVVDDVMIEWELDPGSAARMPHRVAELVRGAQPA